MATVTVEVNVDANGKVTPTPNPAVAGNGDTVEWHLQSKATGKGSVDLILPPENSPFGNSVTSVSSMTKPCERTSQAEPVNWPPGVTSYSYVLQYSASPVISAVIGTLVRSPLVTKGGVTIINNYYFE